MESNRVEKLGINRNRVEFGTLPKPIITFSIEHRPRNENYAIDFMESISDKRYNYFQLDKLT